jgi:transcriptional regulator with PAS, ATPase and Fis domain
MVPREKLPWEDLFELHVLRKLAKIINRRWSLGVGYASADETTVKAPHTSEFAVLRPLCRVIQANATGAHLCTGTAAWASTQLAERHARGDTGALLYGCHAGLMEIAQPVIMDGQYLGCLLAGGFLLAKTAEQALVTVDDRLRPLALPSSDYQEARRDHPRLLPHELAYLTELMELCAEEIVAFQTEVHKSERRIGELERELGTRYSYDAIIGRSPPMQALYRLLDKIVDSESTVLVQGENGTGKELIAKAIHYNSPRKSRRFVIQNCSAFNDNLLDSELFGHKKGSFTGALFDKQGLFEVADGGTFFLDEIGDMSPTLQVKLLRVLQEGTFMPVGDTSPRKVDVRIIAATHRDLKQMVERGEFREDLYYRVNVLALTLPSLRERPDDIPVLIEHFLKKHDKTRRGKKRLTRGCLDRMLAYPWPGNVRELENELERLVVLCGEDKQIRDELLSPRIQKFRQSPETRASSSPHNLPHAVQTLERSMITEALRRHHGNKTRAATELHISRRNLIRLVQRYKLEGRKPSPSA